MPTHGPPPAAFDHVCWGYRDVGEFVTRARDFLADGVAAGERILYVASGDETALAGQLRVDARLDEAFRRGAVQVVPVEAAYRTGTAVDPVTQVERYAAATAEALAAGYTGLRVAADVTSLVRTPAQLDVFARYEHRVDHFMAAHPMSALCGYDLEELGEDVVAQLACLHPAAHAGATPFHLHGHGRPESSAALAGDVDPAARRLWPLALERADLRAAGGTIAIDAAGLTFIDHRGLLAVAAYADRRDTTVTLRTRLAGPARLLELLDLSSVRVEAAW